MPTPTREGFYWAKLLRPVGMPEREDWVSLEWEPVEVFDNNGEGDDSLRVFVGGIAKSQPLRAFEWGDEIIPPPA